MEAEMLRAAPAAYRGVPQANAEERARLGTEPDEGGPGCVAASFRTLLVLRDSIAEYSPVPPEAGFVWQNL